MSFESSNAKEVSQRTVWRFSTARVVTGVAVALLSLGGAGLGAASMTWAAIAEAIGPTSLSFEERLQVILPPTRHDLIDDVVGLEIPTREALAQVGVPERFWIAIDVAHDEIGPAIPAVVPAWPATRGILGVFGVVMVGLGVSGIVVAAVLVLWPAGLVRGG